LVREGRVGAIENPYVTMMTMMPFMMTTFETTTT